MVRKLGDVLSYWLERQGIRALHAAAVVANGRAAAFLSSNYGGKSSLAAAMMQVGCPLLTDDILPVEETGGIFIGRPGYPTMRMWPDEAAYFLGSYEHLPLVHPELSKRRVFVGPDGFGSFCETSQALSCIYLPERRDDLDPTCTISSIRPASTASLVCGKRSGRSSREPLTKSLIDFYCSFQHYIMEATMKTVTAAEANRNFSALLREARQGEVYLVLSRGKPVATIGPALARDAERPSARETLIARLQNQKVTGTSKWTRDELYED